MPVPPPLLLPDAILLRLRLALLLHRAHAGWWASPLLRGLLADALNDRGVTRQQQDDLRSALANLDDALRLMPDHAQALNNRGVVLTELGYADDALADFERVLALRPDNPNPWSNQGNALMQLGRFEAALESYDRALALDPRHLDALRNRGVVLQCLRRFAEARADGARVQADRPDDPEMRYNASLVHLAMGEFETGWLLHEARWAMRGMRADRRDFAQPRWHDGTAGTVLLWSEQGLGDTLQFCRYAPLVGERHDVVLQVPPSLVRLLRSLPRVRAVTATNDPVPAFDAHCPLMSLPLAFCTRLDTIPATIPYLHAEPDQVAHWRARLAPLEGLRVGLVWRGNPRPTNPAANAIDRRRSLTLTQFAPLGRVPGVTLVSLQKANDSVVERVPPGITLNDWTDELEDFADTAALVTVLDLVITVDTAVAHLAGALGRPVWILNRYDACWRWLDGRTDSPWYPTARLFRQPRAGDWDSVIDEVGAALVRLAAQAGR